MPRKKGITLHKEFGVNPTIPVCFLCGKPRNEVVLLGNSYDGQAPMNICMDRIPCEECHKKLNLDEFVLLVETSAPPQYKGSKMVKDAEITGRYMTMHRKDFAYNFKTAEESIRAVVYIEVGLYKHILKAFEKAFGDVPETSI